MGFYNKRNPYRPKAQKQPIRLAFGLVEEPSLAPQAIPTFEVAIPVKQEITGTLDLKNINYLNTKDLQPVHKERILNNLDKIYAENSDLDSSTIIDCEQDFILSLQFRFNQNVIDRIKGLDRNERQWDPEQKIWRVFIGCFDDVFDILGREFKLTRRAYDAIRSFIHSKYYAFIAPNKLGKLILRESFFETLDLDSESFESVHILPGSTLSLNTVDLENNHNELKSLVQKFSFKRNPYSHQVLGIEFLVQNKACALLDEMGCGKSFQIASAVAILLKNKIIQRCLIVAPKSLIHTWQEELALATEIPFRVVGGTPSQRQNALAGTESIFIVHYEGIRLEKEALAEWVQGKDCMVVFDESQRIKNLNAQVTQSAKFIRNHAARCVIATGTPIANRPLDLFPQFYVMDDNIFGKRMDIFENTFCHLKILEIQQGNRKVKVKKFISVKNADTLKRCIQAVSLRRLKSEALDLPPIIVKDYKIPLTGEQKSLYAKIRDRIRNDIENLSEQEYERQSNNVVVRLLRLSQMASNPLLLDKEYTGPNAKISELEDLLQDIFLDDTKKIILWTHFVENVNFLQETYKDVWGAVGHTGEMSIEQRQQSVHEFQNNPLCRLFIATPQSAKEGLTLLPKDGVMRADTMIYLDLNFDAGSYIQSQARFHRIGQNAEKCLVIHLIAEETVDDFIRKTLVDKIQTAARLLDDVQTEETNYSETLKLTKSEILGILRV